MRTKTLITVIAAPALVLSTQLAMADILTTLGEMNVTQGTPATANTAETQMGAADNNAASTVAGAGNLLISDDCDGNCGNLTTTIDTMTINSYQTGTNKATVTMNGGGNKASAGAGTGNISVKRVP